jgi:K+-sensing histidine kinase KdpD
MCAPNAEEKQIEIVTPEEQLVCFGDEDRLTQVIANCLGNAIKYALPSSKIVVAARRQGETTPVTVSDSGRGVPPDKLHSIFEKLEQVMATDSTEKHGVGMGLAICKAIVEEHDGAIGVHSTTGEGSTFWFTVPQAESTQTLEIATGSGN